MTDGAPAKDGLFKYFSVEQKPRGRGPPKGKASGKKSRSKTPIKKRSKAAALPPGGSPPRKAKDAPAKGRARKRWTSEEHLPELRRIVDGWLKKDRGMGYYHGVTLRDYSAHHGINENTLRGYVHKDPKKRKAVAAAKRRGPKAENQLMHPEDRGAYIDYLRAVDRRNEGVGRAAAVQQIMTIKPQLSLKQAQNQFHRIHQQGKKDKVLTGSVIGQKSTSKRTAAINVPDLQEWHNLIDSVMQKMKESNVAEAGVVDPEEFADIMEHFFWNLDEECFLASDGNVRIIGDAAKCKHEIESGSSRISITLLRCGNAAGIQGPVFWLLKGKKRPKGLNDAFLRRHGAPPGSSVIMTDNAFMTNEACNVLSIM